MSTHKSKLRVKEKGLLYQAESKVGSNTLSTALDEEKQEMELNLRIHQLMSYKTNLKEILKRYRVKKPEEIKKMIALGKAEEHPSYEDYLDACGYEELIKELKTQLGNSLRKI